MMFKQKTIIYLFVAVIFICDSVRVTNALLKGATAIDDVRARYMALEADSWNVVENGADRKAVLTHVFNNHHQFVEEFLKKDFKQDDFLVANQFSEWLLLEAEVLWPTEKLFEQFRSLLNNSDEFFDELVNKDFADTVLNDKVSVQEGLDKIENTMTKQALYYRVGAVCIKMS